MRKEDYRNFFGNYLRHQYTEEEHRAFVSWFASLDTVQAEEVMKEYEVMVSEQVHEGTSATDLLLLSKIEGRLDEWEDLRKESLKRHWLVRVWPRVAAAAGLVLGLYSVYYGIHRRLESSSEKPEFVQTDVAPGDNKALLTLSDGSSIVLSDAGMGEIAKQALVRVEKDEDGQLVYAPTENYKFSAENLKKEYNTVATPKSGQYQVLLPDGTKVRLNSMSSLRFPVTFDPVERKVQLSGEAYFEVAGAMSAGHRIPFRVVSNGQVIEVTGTKFNVNTFSDDSYIKTTLLEGGVKVREQSTGNSVQLKPGEQSLVRMNAPARGVSGRKDIISVRKADVEGDLAWTNGYFHFKDTDLKEVMQQLIRWYDIEVEYIGNISSERFNGYVSRKVSLSNVLAILQHGSEVRFELTDKGKVKIFSSNVEISSNTEASH